MILRVSESDTSTPNICKIRASIVSENDTSNIGSKLVQLLINQGLQ
ncbi:hypothetical protein [Clostridium tyrobutyricum]|nr:hypothetical protein [Clostridium tyrobutyricum]MBV4417062.1 hypothetical protein [Clostridium tyrobutyricum]